MNELKLSCRLVKAPKMVLIDEKMIIKFVVVHFPDQGETIALHCEMDYTKEALLQLDTIALGTMIGITGLITKRKDKGIRIDVVGIKETV